MGSAGSADDGECTCLILASPGCAWLCAVWPHGHFVPLWHSQLGPQWCLLHSAAGSDFTIFTSIAQPFEILLRSFEPRIQARNPCQCKDHGGHCLHVLPAWMAPDLQCSSDDQWRETHFLILFSSNFQRFPGTWSSSCQHYMLTTKILRLDWRRIWVLGDKMLSELIERDSTWGVGFVPSATLKFSSLAPPILSLQNLSQFSWAISAGHWKGQFPGICPDLSRHQGTLLVNHV